jgi:hypothetical protein
MILNKFKIHKKNKKHKRPKERTLYAFNKTRPGDFILTAQTFKDYTEFMYLPGGNPFCITNETFEELINNDELTLVEQLPVEIFEESFKYFCCIKSKNEIRYIE